MKRNIILAAALLVASVSAKAQSLSLPEGMEILTPEGVTVTTVSDRSIYDKTKNIVIAGSPSKGYKAFFTAKEDTHGEELWVSDGTVDGTKMVKDIYPGSVSSNVQYITRFNDKVVFQAVGDDESGNELWISDGTEEGTFMVKDINEIGDSNPRGFVQLDETRFVFAATDVESATYGDEEQQWLWIRDGTTDGTKLLKDCRVKYPGTASSNDMAQFVRVGRKVFFKADTKDNEYTETLWVTDGTEDGTIMLSDINTTVADEATGKTGSAQIDWLTNVNNKWCFFKAYSAEYGSEPWYSDGTVEGTHMIGDFTPGVDANNLPLGDGVFTTCALGDKVVYRGRAPHDDFYKGIELVITDGTDEGTQLLLDINQVPNNTGTNNGVPDVFPFSVWQGCVWGKGQTGVNTSYDFCRGLELFYTDGTPEGSAIHSDLNPGVGPNAAWEGTPVSGSLYMRAQDHTPQGSQLWELFRLDNKSDEKPVQVVDLAEGQDYVHSLRNLDGDLVFTSVAVPRLFRYHYRKANYDPAVDKENMEPSYVPAGTTGINATGLLKGLSGCNVRTEGSDIAVVSEDVITGVTVSDIAGRVHATKTSMAKRVLVPAQLPSGMYTVTVRTVKGTTTKKLLVK